MYMIIPYYKGALFDYINVQTLVSYATNNQLHYDRQKPAKKPYAKTPQKSMAKTC